MRSVKRHAAAGILLGLGLAPMGAWANPVLDQEYTPTPNIQYAGFSNGPIRRAETFTVGLAGTLVEVQVDTNSTGSSFSGVNILSTSGGTPTTTVLDLGTFDSTNASGVATFTVSLPVTVGEVLGIEPVGGNSYWQQHAGTYPSSPYAGGGSFLIDTSFGQDSFAPEYAADGFATYVDPPGASPVPEPMSLAMLASGVVGLTFARRGAKE